jgi:hypothetical protein
MTFPTIKNQLEPLKKVYPDYHIGSGFLIRVLFNREGDTCLLIGRDQPKVVLTNIVWNGGVDQFRLLINMNSTLWDDFMGLFNGNT